MALQSLMGIPGLGGYLGMEQYRQQQALGNLQGQVGLMNAVRQQQVAEQEAQMAPMRMQLMQAQVGDVKRKSDAAQALDAAIASLPPEQQAIARLSPQSWAAAQMKQDEPRIVPQGGVLVRGDKPVFTNPKVEPKSSFEKILDAAGVSDPAQRSQLLQAYLKKQVTHAPASSNTVIQMQEREESKAVGKAQGEQFNDILKSGFDAGSKINRYDRIAQLLEGVNTGKLTPTATQIAAVADSVGLKIDPKLGEKQAAIALANEIALTLRNPSGGAGMPGALSDKDREFLVSMTPSLATSSEGNRLIIDTAKKLAKRDQDVAKLAREYRQKNGSFGPGFYEELQKFSESNPLFQPGAAPKKSDFEVGKVYVDGNGRRAKYLGDGKWQNQ